MGAFKCSKFKTNMFMQKMLIYNPGERLSAVQAMQHPYFSDLDKQTLPADSP